MALENSYLIERVERFLGAEGKHKCSVPFEALRIAAGVPSVENEAIVIAAAEHLKTVKGWNYAIHWLQMEVEFSEP